MKGFWHDTPVTMSDAMPMLLIDGKPYRPHKGDWIEREFVECECNCPPQFPRCAPGVYHVRTKYEHQNRLILHFPQSDGSDHAVHVIVMGHALRPSGRLIDMYVSVKDGE